MTPEEIITELKSKLYYEVVFEKREELHLRVVELKNMPMYSAMPQAERDLIGRWILEGSVE